MQSAAAWLQRLKAVECLDATFPSSNPPVVFDVAQGSLIRSVDGAEYIDLCAGFGALPLGHNSAPMREAFSSRASEGFAPMTHGMGDVFASKAKVELLETLVASLPAPLSRAALALSGSQAVEFALKTAVLRTKKCGFIVFENGYHGVELGVLPLTAREDFRAPFAGWSAPGCVVRLPYGCAPDLIAKAVSTLNATRDVGFAGICVEPVQGRAGVRPADLGWLESLHDLCRKNHGLLIFDEVFVGLGRTGRLSFSEIAAADLVCLGKALGGGMPLSACVGTEDAMQAWPESQGEAIHTGTFFGHPLSCEVGLRTLRVLLEEDWPRQVHENGQRWLDSLHKRFANHPLVSDIRGQGYMWAIEMSEPGLGAKITDQLRAAGVLALPSGANGEVLSFTPSYNIPGPMLEEAFDRLEKVLAILA